MSDRNENKWLSKIHEGWDQEILPKIWRDERAKQLSAFLNANYTEGTCAPPKMDIMNAFSHCGPKDVRVVLIAQDPYSGRGQANGLAFSVPKDRSFPPSLVNIFKEIERDLPGTKHNTGDLQCWAKQGVLLLNSILTVRFGLPASHANSGWEQITDRILEGLQEVNENIVYLLWGNFARTKKGLIKKSLGVLEAPHPSPHSVGLGFEGCGHFSKTNQLLEKAGLKPIDWST